MLYPQGKTVIGDLKTAFVNIDGGAARIEIRTIHRLCQNIV